MIESKEFKNSVFDYITDRAATYCLGSAIRCIVIGVFGRDSRIKDLETAIYYLQFCIDKELEYVMHDTDNCDYSVVELIKDYGLNVNCGNALIAIDTALNHGMNFETDKVRERLNYAIARLLDELNKITPKKGE